MLCTAVTLVLSLLCCHAIQGGTLAYIMMISQPAMQDKVASLLAMGPPVFLEYMRAPVLFGQATARNDLVRSSRIHQLHARLLVKGLEAGLRSRMTQDTSEYFWVQTYSTNLSMSQRKHT